MNAIRDQIEDFVERLVTDQKLPKTLARNVDQKNTIVNMLEQSLHELGNEHEINLMLTSKPGQMSIMSLIHDIAHLPKDQLNAFNKLFNGEQIENTDELKMAFKDLFKKLLTRMEKLKPPKPGMKPLTEEEIDEKAELAAMNVLNNLNKDNEKLAKQELVSMVKFTFCMLAIPNAIDATQEQLFIAKGMNPQFVESKATNVDDLSQGGAGGQLDKAFLAVSQSGSIAPWFTDEMEKMGLIEAHSSITAPKPHGVG